MQQSTFMPAQTVSRLASPRAVSVTIAGTGGLGVIGLARSVAEMLMTKYPCVHTEETRGIAQRRAPVSAVVRAGFGVRSARIPNGTVDYLLAVEAAEALRQRHLVGAGTVCLLADLLIPPSGTASLAGNSNVLSLSEIEGALTARGASVRWIPVAKWLAQSGQLQALASTAIFGAICRALDVPATSVEAIVTRGARTSPANRHAFDIGFGVTAPAVPEAAAALPAFIAAPVAVASI